MLDESVSFHCSCLKSTCKEFSTVSCPTRLEAIEKGTKGERVYILEETSAQNA